MIGDWWPVPFIPMSPPSPWVPGFMNPPIPIPLPPPLLYQAPLIFTTPVLGVPDREAKLYFTLGCQRSGKSTLARMWLHRQAPLVDEVDDGFPRFLWDTDVLRLRLYGQRYNRGGEAIAFAIKELAIAAALDLGHDVVVAGTHSTHTSIRRILEIRRDAIPVLVDTPLEVCLERARDTNQEDLLKVIPRVHRQVQLIKEIGVSEVIAGILEDMDDGVKY